MRRPHLAELRGGFIGGGYFARYHLHACRELDGVEIVVPCSRRREHAQAYADQFDIQAVYADAEATLRTEELDFVDIVTHPGRPPAFRPLGGPCFSPESP